MYQGFKKALSAAGVILGVWLSLRFFLPLGLPFLLGGTLALAAEPMTGFLTHRLKLRRSAASGIAVTAAFLLFFLLVLLVCALILRELAALVRILPNLEDSLSGGLSALSAWALSLAAKMPQGIREHLERTIQDFFSGSSALLQQAFRFALGFTGGVLSAVPGSALVLGTAVISSYMISIRLPRIKSYLRAKIPPERIQKMRASLERLKTALVGWLMAQAKLMGLTWVILTLGLVLLRVSYAPIWAFGIALVDAVPLLGTGIILLPWSLISLVQKNNLLAIGLLATYGAASICRTLWEPRLLGKQLGLDPLVTLMALYFGYQAWGILGMIFSPLLAVTAIGLTRDTPNSP
jgi:sporulation integral membrane protein YtvI